MQYTLTFLLHYGNTFNFFAYSLKMYELRKQCSLSNALYIACTCTSGKMSLPWKRSISSIKTVVFMEQRVVTMGPMFQTDPGTGINRDAGSRRHIDEICSTTNAVWNMEREKMYYITSTFLETFIELVYMAEYIKLFVNCINTQHTCVTHCSIQLKKNGNICITKVIILWKTVILHFTPLHNQN